MMREYNVSGIPIVEDSNPPSDTADNAQRMRSNGKPPRLLGIMTRRDLKFQEDDSRRIGDVMTKEKLITAPEHTTLDEAERILYHAKVEKRRYFTLTETPRADVRTVEEYGEAAPGRSRRRPLFSYWSS